MAKASVATLFRAYCLANHAREALITRMGDDQERKAVVTELGMNYGQALAATVRLNSILENCNFEVEIPPEFEPFLGGPIEISSRIHSSIGVSRQGRIPV
jgi:hypothetical protein